MISTRESVGIAELVLFIPFAFITPFIVYRHGFYKQLGWLFLAIFSALRVATGGLIIASAKNPDNVNDAVWAGILGAIGLSPLLLATMGLLSRVNVEVLVPSNARILILRFIHLPITLALILGIVGGVEFTSSKASDVSTGVSLSKAACIIFVVCYVGLIIVAFWTGPQDRQLPASERHIIYAVLASAPFLAVRLIYSLIANFGHVQKIKLYNGSPVVQFFMSTFMELIIVIFYSAAGLAATRLNKIPPAGAQPAPQKKWHMHPQHTSGDNVVKTEV